MKLYIVHELEVAGDASIADLRAAVRQASEGFRAALAPVGAASGPRIQGRSVRVEPDIELAAFVAAEVCK